VLSQRDIRRRVGKRTMQKDILHTFTRAGRGCLRRKRRGRDGERTGRLRQPALRGIARMEILNGECLGGRKKRKLIITGEADQRRMDFESPS